MSSLIHTVDAFRLAALTACIRLCSGVPVRNEKGQATAEYGAVILIAVALGLAVFAIIKGGGIDGVLQSLLVKVLQQATKLIKG